MFQINPIFLPGGKYGTLPPLPENIPWVELGEKVEILNSNQSGSIWDFPTAKYNGKNFAGNNNQATWGDFGPKWFSRTYNTRGVTKNMKIARIGDFEKGREGHAFYENVMGSRSFDNILIGQCGGQAWQVVTRTTETKIPMAQWGHDKFIFSLKNCHIRDCGIINAGAAVRASWNITFYNPGRFGEQGMSLHIENCTDWNEYSPIYTQNKTKFRSKGILFVGPPSASAPAANPKEVLVSNFNTYLVAPDREDFRIWDAEELVMENVTAGRTSISGVAESPQLSLVNVGRVTLKNWNLSKPLKIQIHNPAKPYNSPTQTKLWDGEGVFEN